MRSKEELEKLINEKYQELEALKNEFSELTKNDVDSKRINFIQDYERKHPSHYNNHIIGMVRIKEDGTRETYEEWIERLKIEVPGIFDGLRYDGYAKERYKMYHCYYASTYISALINVKDPRVRNTWKYRLKYKVD